MKCIKYACLEQTVCFQVPDAPDREQALRAARGEAAAYRAQLDRRHTKYRILSEEAQPNGAWVLKICRQYNDYSVGDYLD